MKIKSQLLIDFEQKCSRFSNVYAVVDKMRSDRPRTIRAEIAEITNEVLVQMVEAAEYGGLKTDVDELKEAFGILNSKKTVTSTPAQTPIEKLRLFMPTLLTSTSNGNGFHEVKFIPGNIMQNIEMLGLLSKGRFYDIIQFSTRKAEAPIIRHYDIKLLEVQNTESSILFKLENNIILNLENGSILFTPSKVQIV